MLGESALAHRWEFCKGVPNSWKTNLETVELESRRLQKTAETHFCPGCLRCRKELDGRAEVGSVHKEEHSWLKTQGAGIAWLITAAIQLRSKRKKINNNPVAHKLLNVWRIRGCSFLHRSLKICWQNLYQFGRYLSMEREEIRAGQLPAGKHGFWLAIAKDMHLQQDHINHTLNQWHGNQKNECLSLLFK